MTETEWMDDIDFRKFVDKFKAVFGREPDAYEQRIVRNMTAYHFECYMDELDEYRTG